jgi:hypothetical protein
MSRTTIKDCDSRRWTLFLVYKGADTRRSKALFFLHLSHSLQSFFSTYILSLLLLQRPFVSNIIINMKFSALALGSAIATANAAVLGDRSQFAERATYAVVGKPEGFATGTTGGGSAACAIPSSVAQLKTWLTDSTARCIVLDKE